MQEVRCAAKGASNLDRRRVAVMAAQKPAEI